MEIGTSQIQVDQDRVFSLPGEQDAQVGSQEGFAASTLAPADSIDPSHFRHPLGLLLKSNLKFLYFHGIIGYVKEKKTALKHEYNDSGY